MKDKVSEYLSPPSPLTSTAPQSFSNILTMPVHPREESNPLPDKPSPKVAVVTPRTVTTQDHSSMNDTPTPRRSVVFRLGRRSRDPR
jgi:hypothetical protein